MDLIRQTSSLDFYKDGISYHMQSAFGMEKNTHK